MRVLVTGGAGFIGSNFVHYALRERPAWELTVLDKLTYAGNLENLAEPLKEKRITFVRGDIADQQAMFDLFKAGRFDLVFHFAAESHVDRSIHSAEAFVTTNVLGTQTLLDAGLTHGCGAFVHVSTDEVYGSLGPTGRFVETTPLDPTSPYAASKASSDLMVLACCKTHSFPGVVTRCTNNYGPFQFPEKVIPLFVTNALEDQPLPLYGDGKNVRSWLYVDDHAEALIAIGERGKRGEVYNIGGAEEAELPNIDLTSRILSLLGKPDTLIKYVSDRPAHDRRYAIDYSKINRELGWKPRTSVDDGLRATVEWYRGNRAWWETVKSGEYQAYYERHYGQRGVK